MCVCGGGGGVGWGGGSCAFTRIKPKLCYVLLDMIILYSAIFQTTNMFRPSVRQM